VTHETYYAVQAPWMLGLIATRSLDKAIPGIFDLVEDAKTRISRGVEGYEAMRRLKGAAPDPAAREIIERRQRDLGYAMLLRRYTDNPSAATPEQIEKAAWDTIPNVPVIFWSFRVMVALGFYFIALFAVMFYLSSKRAFEQRRWLLHVAVWSLPLPWVAAELGWIVAEYGRQPWIIEGVLPTFLAASPIRAGNVWLSLSGFVLFYTALLIVDVFLMVKYVRLGPTETWEVPDLATRQAPPGGAPIGDLTPVEEA
jgi:cytochrome d ubiquinol oxidase subunit I